MAKSKTKKKKPPVEAETTFDFYVIVQDGSNPEQYVVDYNPETHTPAFGTNFDDAFWSTKVNKVTTFISQNQIQNATATGKNGDHPAHRPPL